MGVKAHLNTWLECGIDSARKNSFGRGASVRLDVAFLGGNGFFAGRVDPRLELCGKISGRAENQQYHDQRLDDGPFHRFNG